MKKYLSIIMAAILMAGCLTSCGSLKSADAAVDDQIRIVTTIFPEYDWVMNILGSNPANAEVTMLLDSGVDLHSYQPTADDILKVSSCDMFIYVGGESDEWVEDVLKEAVNKDMVVVNLLNVLGDSVKEEEVVEGMQEEEHDHDHGEDADEHGHGEADDPDHEEDHDHEEADDPDHEEAEDHDHEEAEGHDHEEEETEYDEHVWLSLRNAKVLTQYISDKLQQIDVANADEYRTNTEAYTNRLSDLDKQYSDITSGASVKTLLFGDRFPFRYLTDDYGLYYYAAFVGCSAETEASFETITFLAGKVDELSLHSVMTIEGADHRIAETIVQNTADKDQQILSLDSMQSTTKKDVENGVTYLSVMESNLEVLKEALK